MALGYSTVELMLCMPQKKRKGITSVNDERIWFYTPGKEHYDRLKNAFPNRVVDVIMINNSLKMLLTKEFISQLNQGLVDVIICSFVKNVVVVIVMH